MPYLRGTEETVKTRAPEAREMRNGYPLSTSCLYGWYCASERHR
jgi:hypothetical protein